MDCPFCRHNKTDVYNSRRTKGGNRIWRRRRCLRCEEVFTTYEFVDLGFLAVIKKDGSAEPFLRSKLFASIYNACSQLNNQAVTVDAITDTIESKLLDLEQTNVSTRDIAKIVLTTLQHFNSAAFIRYLSYRTEFADKQQLSEVLQQLS